jgi:hypothetical protein
MDKTDFIVPTAEAQPQCSYFVQTVSMPHVPNKRHLNRSWSIDPKMPRKQTFTALPGCRRASPFVRSADELTEPRYSELHVSDHQLADHEAFVQETLLRKRKI